MPHTGPQVQQSQASSTTPLHYQGTVLNINHLMVLLSMQDGVQQVMSPVHSDCTGNEVHGPPRHVGGQAVQEHSSASAMSVVGQSSSTMEIWADCTLENSLHGNGHVQTSPTDKPSHILPPLKASMVQYL
ncbi:hypothetical protein FRB94_012946 [Tulasnella sp. JGI-2019a]|nr:hypothetical protein FRB94_012946 [Tulasnella sp. JGI-2019a]